MKHCIHSTLDFTLEILFSFTDGVIAVIIQFMNRLFTIIDFVILYFQPKLTNYDLK